MDVLIYTVFQYLQYEISFKYNTEEIMIKKKSCFWGIAFIIRMLDIKKYKLWKFS